MEHISRLLVFLFFSVTVLGQEISVTGTIYDQTLNEPLPGVNVYVKGTNNGTSSDFDGNFSINNVNIGDILVFSYISFVTKEVSVVDDSPLKVYMNEDVASLDEVVVIGYGTQTKKEITGAVAVVGAETIEELNPTRIEQALQGQVAGVNITSQSGSPGSASTISIRGISTNGDNRPLILVDGARIEDLSVLNPNEIESINILKDATAGIYGVQAANGVILITTKSGRKNAQLKFSYDAWGGFQQTSRSISVLNATEYGLLVNEAFVAGGQSPPFKNLSGLGVGTNWQDQVFQNAPIFNHNFSVSGGGKKSSFSFNTSLLAQDGIVGGNKSNFKRYSTRINYNLDLLKDLKLTSNVSYSGTIRKALPENAIGSILYSALNAPPTSSVKDESDNFTLFQGVGIEVVNPLALIENTFNTAKVNRISGKIGLDFKVVNNISLTSNFQFNYAEVNGRVFSPIVDFGGSVFDQERSFLSENEDVFKDYIWDNYISFEKEIADRHNLNATLGISYSSELGQFSGVTQGFFTEPTTFGQADFRNAIDINNALLLSGLSGRFKANLFSSFFRVQYGYNQKYLFSFLARRDGSSRFGPKDRFGFFPSGSIGWIVSEEDFMSQSKTFNFLKLRGSYGIIGNNRIAENAFRSILNGEGTYVLNESLVFGQAVGVLPNPEIQWEEQKTLDIGVDMKLLSNSIDITADYFSRTTDGLLLQPQVSGILGANAPGAQAPFVNGGEVNNSGFELAVRYQNDRTKDFNFSINYNVTFLENEVKEVNNEAGFLQGGSFGVGQDPPARMEAGKPIGFFFGLETDGIFQNQAEVNAHATIPNAGVGDLRFVDQNEDGVIDSNDRVDIGNPIPDATMGLNISANYKNFDFSAYAFASVGNDIVRNYERDQPLVNQSVFVIDRFIGEGSTNQVPRVTTGATSNTLFSDFFVEDGSFMRIQNAQIGYTLPNKTMEKLGADKLRVYLSANNLFTFTKYRGFDPSASSGAPIGSGIDLGFYPVPRSYLLGVNFKF